MPDGDFTRQLRLEIARWQDEGLISAAQAAAILRRYSPPPDEVPAAGPAAGGRCRLGTGRLKFPAAVAAPAGVDAAAPTAGIPPGGQVTEEVPAAAARAGRR